jgi:hypothetical protein
VWVTALFGLIGVIVGGSLTGIVNLLLERRRERAELRAVVRLLQVELDDPKRRLTFNLHNGRWGSLAIEPFPTNILDEYQLLLARLLKDDPWERVREAYGSIRDHNENAVPLHDPTQSIAGELEEDGVYSRHPDEEGLRRLLEEVEGALLALDPVARGRSLWGLRGTE